MPEIRVFHTHIEVYPYQKGDRYDIEKLLSTYDPATHSLIPIGYYIQNDILYLPRGISTTLLADKFRASPTMVTKCDDYTKIKKGSSKYKPKSTMQDHAIKFLCAEDQFAYTGRYSQLGLNLQTGDGKTYSAVTAILKYKIKAIIITHQDKIKQQWIKSFTDMTTFPEEELINISGTDVMEMIMKGKIKGEVYLVNHQTIESYARVHGWTKIREFFKKIKVGIKIIDESHKFFTDTLMLDFFSNCYKTFYLTATYGRSDSSNVVYKRAFASLTRFGEETLNYKDKRKHTNFVITYFKSRPKYGVTPDFNTYYGFSAYKYIDYELNESNEAIYRVLETILDKTSNLEGKTLIFSPKIDSVEKIAEYVKNYTSKKVGILHSKSEDNQADVLESDIISTTVKSAGEGLDIKGLRIIICLEPIGSQNLADQVRGRLREYSKEDDTFMFYVVDTSVHKTVTYLKNILPAMKKTCKELMTISLNV